MEAGETPGRQDRAGRAHGYIGSPRTRATLSLRVRTFLPRGGDQPVGRLWGVQEDEERAAEEQGLTEGDEERSGEEDRLTSESTAGLHRQGGASLRLGPRWPRRALAYTGVEWGIDRRDLLVAPTAFPTVVVIVRAGRSTTVRGSVGPPAAKASTTPIRGSAPGRGPELASSVPWPSSTAAAVVAGGQGEPVPTRLALSDEISVLAGRES